MAKAKRKKKSTKKTVRRRAIKPMATKRRKKRRSTSVRRTTLSSKPVRRRRKKRGLFDGSTGLMSIAKNNAAGAIGGLLFLGTRMVEMPRWVRTVSGFGGAVAASYFKMPFVGAGIAGATAYHLGEGLMPSGLLHDDLEDAEYVDRDTLSDSGYETENGNPILVADNGNAYALNDNGELEEMSDAFSLNDGTDMQSVSMLPLSDSNPYALSMASGY